MHMDIQKHIEYFNPIEVDEMITIIGVGALGSHLAIMLARLGCKKITLYDDDKVADINLSNQSYDKHDIDRYKVIAIAEDMKLINTQMKISVKPERYTKQPLSGYVFVCVDSIETRKAIATHNRYNPNIKCLWDMRMRLEDAQGYTVPWHDKDAKDNYFETMTFTDAEFKAEVPVSPCGSILAIIPTIQIIVSLICADFINCMKTELKSNLIIVNPFTKLIL